MQTSGLSSSNWWFQNKYWVLFCVGWIFIAGSTNAKLNTFTLLVPYNKHRCFLESVSKQFSYKLNYLVLEPMLPEAHHELMMEAQKFSFMVKHTKTSRMVLYRGATQKGSFMWNNKDGWTRILETCIFNYHQETVRIKITTATAYETGDISSLPYSNANHSLIPYLSALEAVVHEIPSSKEYLQLEAEELSQSTEMASHLISYSQVCMFVVALVLVLQTIFLKGLLIERKTK